jgi:uncharacterized protein YodC (DUF2158 family)
MSDSQFKAGDVVRLKSGGPQMTIEGIGPYSMSSKTNRAKCLWFEGTKRMEGLFELITLKDGTA